jgi:hypothetical protein
MVSYSAAAAVLSLSHRERAGVRGYGPSIVRCPLTRFAAQIDLSRRGEVNAPAFRDSSSYQVIKS